MKPLRSHLLPSAVSEGHAETVAALFIFIQVLLSVHRLIQCSDREALKALLEEESETECSVNERQSIQTT